MTEKTGWMQVKVPEFPWQRLKRLEENNAAIQEENIQLKQQVQALTEQNRAIANENYSFQQQVAALTKRQEQLVGSNQELGAANAALQNENITLRKQLSLPSNIENNKRIDYYEVLSLYSIADSYDHTIEEMKSNIERGKVDLNAPVPAGAKIGEVIDMQFRLLLRGSKDFKASAARFEKDFSQKYSGDTTTAYRNTHNV